MSSFKKIIIIAIIALLSSVLSVQLIFRSSPKAEELFNPEIPAGEEKPVVASINFAPSARYNQPLIVTAADYSLSIRPLNALAAEMQTSPGDKSIVGYENAYKNTDVIQTREPNKIKEDIILKAPGHPDKFAYQIDLAKYDFVKNENGDLVFYPKGEKNNDLKRIFTIPAPFMVDSNNKISSTNDVKMTLSNDGILTIVPSKNWLSQAVYPVILDPTIEINILNIHSHPAQGQNWVVSFTTQGQADLKIIPNDQATIDDDEFVSLWCGDEQRTPQILPGDIIFYPSWSCDGVGKVVHKTLKAGNHTLRFEFGPAQGEAEQLVVYAYNETMQVSSATDTTWQVPAGVTSITVKAWGAGGGGGGESGGVGGGGGFAQATLAVIPDETLNIVVGGGGDDTNAACLVEVNNAGYGGGGHAVTYAGGGNGGCGNESANGAGGGGGGMASVQRDSDNEYLIIAGGGGGGGGGISTAVGGGGGGTTGQNGGDGGLSAPGGGGQADQGGTAGTTSGTPAVQPTAGGSLSGGLGGASTDDTSRGGGGGGGGLYGGGGGGGANDSNQTSGGGGGSGKVTGTATTLTQSTGQTAANNSDSDKVANCSATGTGGSAATNGQPGCIIIIYTAGGSAPTVTTNAATSITQTSARLNGEITATGGADATEHGFAWGTNANLANGDTATTTLGSKVGTGTFYSDVSTLTCNTTYYFRAYATNTNGTGYGTILNFTSSTCSGGPYTTVILKRNVIFKRNIIFK